MTGALARAAHLPTGASDARTLLALVLLAVGTLLAAWAVGHRRWEVPGAALAAAGAAAWTLTNVPYEGVVLLRLTPQHGFSAADLATLPALLLVAHLTWRSARP